MLQYFIVLIIIFPANFGWKIDIKDNSDTLQTNITLTCHFDATSGGSPMLEDVYRIRISKFNNQKEWDTVATLASREPAAKTTMQGATTNGLTDKPGNSFLSIHFNVMTTEVVGKYMCEVDGFDNTMDVKVVKTPPVDVVLRYLQNQKHEDKESNSKHESELESMKKSIELLIASNERLSHVINMTSDNQVELSHNQEGISKSQLSLSNAQVKLNKYQQQIYNEQLTLNDYQRKLDQKVEKLTAQGKQEHDDTVSNITDVTDKLAKVFSSLTNRIDNIENKLSGINDAQLKLLDLIKNLQNTGIISKPTVKTTTAFPEITEWPSGIYALPKSKNGCPRSDAFPWRLSSFRVSTNPFHNNSDSSSSQLDLYGNVFQQSNNHRYVYMEFCTKQVSITGEKPWPKGHYCVQKYSSSCPIGFGAGDIAFNRYDDGKKDSFVNLPNMISFNGHDLSFVEFCCRADGDDESPIALPSVNSFFLYRFGGRCQVVHGMTVVQQWVKFDTRHHMGGFGGTAFPDGYTNIKNGIKFFLCFYTPNSV